MKQSKIAEKEMGVPAVVSACFTSRVELNTALQVLVCVHTRSGVILGRKKSESR